MKSIILLLFSIFLSCANLAFAQKVSFLNLNQLENRIAVGKDTVYVINFWATWCPPCVKELPNFEKLGAQYKNTSTKVILLSLDFKSNLENSVKPFVSKNKIQSEVYVSKESSQQKFIERVSKNWSGSLPATLIINKTKGIRNFYEQDFTFEELEKVYLENL